MTNPGSLPDEDALALKEISAGCPELDAATQHVRDFATMMRDLTGSELPAWMERVEHDNSPHCTPWSTACAGLRFPRRSGGADQLVRRG
ncbi:hypothetical protein [Streptomyces sp. WZ-12]|uniref:hypothetical protein n=1 Tax=Streptomyces sp. WZ-12 TaxID=3030210 RepID=UPI002380D8D1|nr:hypothetical protein [Streptomyces sp. WZ-12]